MMRGLARAIGFALAFMLPVAAYAASQDVEIVRLSDLGYESSIVLRGTQTFTAFLPIYPQLRRATLSLPMEISPDVDPNSSITVGINGVPASSVTVERAGFRPNLQVPLPLPPGSLRSVEVTVTVHLFKMRDRCEDDSGPNMWATIPTTAAFRLETTAFNPQYIADWFRDYGGRVNIVVDRSVPDDVRLAALALPYSLQQVARWRSTTIGFSDRRDPTARNVVVGSFARSLELRGSDLYVSRSGIGLLTAFIGPMLLTNSVTNASYAASATPPPVKQLSLAQLGLPRETRSGGAGEISFTIPFSLADVGGHPDGLQFVFGLTHTALQGDQTGTVDVRFNDVLVRSYALSASGGEETFAAPIDSSLIHGSNTVKVSTLFRSGQGAGLCAPADTFTVSLLDSSGFTWGSVRKAGGGIGDFFQSSHGRMIVLLGRDDTYTEAFALLEKLGEVNTSIQSIAVERFTGTIAAEYFDGTNTVGYDEALVVASSPEVAALKPEFNPNGSAFSIVDQRSSRTLYTASYSQPFGVLETLQTSAIPALVATYWGDRTILDTLGQFSGRLLASQVDTIFLFDRDYVAYGPTDASRARIKGPPNPVAILAYGGLALAVLGIVVVIFMGTRSSRKARQAAAPQSS